MPRYVLLYHECPAGYERPSHWDLMLEAEGVLRTWALARLPRGWAAARAATAVLVAGCAAVSGGDQVDAERLADHRLDYLHLAGPLSGGRGHVRQIDRGTYQAGCRLSASGGRPDDERRSIGVVLAGRLVRAEIVLRADERGGARWTLTSRG